MITLYGINNCDTVKKAKTWLTDHAIDFHFYDFKKVGLPTSVLDSFLSLSNWDVLLNKRGTTFRQLPEHIKNNLSHQVIYDAVLAQPMLLKRPLLLKNKGLTVGFNIETYTELLI